MRAEGVVCVAVVELGRSDRPLRFRDPGAESGLELAASGKHRRTGGRRSPGAARAIGRGKIRVAEANRDAIDRHVHRLGGDLGEDRIGAGADVGHGQLDGQPAIALQARACARVLQEVAADCRGDAHPDEPAPVANARGLGDASLPTEAGGAFAQAFGEMARGKRLVQFRLDLRIIA